MTLRIKIIAWLIFTCCINAFTHGESFGRPPDRDTLAERLTSELGKTSAPQQKLNKYYDLGQHFISKAGEERIDVSNAKKYCHLGLELSLKQKSPLGLARGNTLLSQIYREEGLPNQGKKYINIALSYSKHIADPAVLASTFIEKSQYYSLANDSNYVLKSSYYKKGVIYLRKAYPNSLQLADALKFLGDLNVNDIRGNLAVPGLNLFYEALAIYRAKSYERLQDIYDLIGVTLSDIGRTREGLKYSLLAVRTAERFKDSSMTTCAIYNRLAYTYNNLQDDRKSADCMEKAIMYARHNHEETTAYLLTGNLAVAYIDLKQYRRAAKIAEGALSTVPKDQIKIRVLLHCDLVRVYTAMKSYNLAQQHYIKATQLSEGTIQPDIIWDLMYSSGIRLFMTLHNFEQVNKLIEKYSVLSAKMGNLMSAGQLEEFAYKADSAQHHFDRALVHFQAFKKLNDSLTNRNHDKQTAQLQLQFETEKKDKDIKVKAKDIQLLQRQTALQKESLKNEKWIRNLSIAAVIMLLILTAVSYNRFKIKQQANHALQEQQEEINTQNEALRQLLDERDWLLKEVHHRVKNNLQIVISLLNSQLANIKDGVAQEVIRESQHRMQSISLIHQKLYQFDNLTGIDAGSYIQELALYLQDSFNTPGRIKFIIKAAPIVLDVSQAVPVGLILNEAITNSIKYAFTDQVDKCISISLSNTSSSQVELKVSDNGNGLPYGFDAKNNKSLGMQLMNGLSKQLRAKLAIISDEGVCILVTWDKTEPSSLYNKTIVATSV